MGGAAQFLGFFPEAELGFNAARGFVGGAATWNEKVFLLASGFNAARGFVGGAAKRVKGLHDVEYSFQCRTRLCGWCSNKYILYIFNNKFFKKHTRGFCCFVVSMPHAALWVVQQPYHV